MQGFNYKKAVQTLNLFAISEGGQINKMKAIKLVWLSNRDHLRRYGRPIFFDRYYAMKLGPVPSNTKDLAEIDTDFLAEEELAYRNSYINPIDKYFFRSVSHVDQSVFSETDIMSLNHIYSNFGSYTEFSLSEISHQFPEWKKFEDSLNSGQGCRFEMKVQDFFENIGNQLDDIFVTNQEDIELSKFAFNEREALELL